MNFDLLSSEDRRVVAHKKLGITSPDFRLNEFIPRRFTFDGINVNPALNIEHIPKKAATLAIIVDDPDAPNNTWVHWVIWNISPLHHLDEDDAPGIQGMNDFGKAKYSGPCPPRGTHRYFFKVYALDTALEIPEGSDRNELDKAMKNHILAFGELVGLYRRD